MIPGYKCWTGLLGTVLLLSTWRLWGGQSDYPQVPLIDEIPLLGSVSNGASALSWVTLCLMILACAALIFSPFLRAAKSKLLSSWLIGLYCLGFAITVLIDQHRLQPWALQIFGLSLLLASSTAGASDRRTLFLARVFVIGIYVWSAIGKLDAQFIYTVGTEMLSTLVRIAGFDADAINPQRFATAAIFLPILELALAVCLCFQRTRIIGVAMGVLMHLLLILILGPLGLGHQPAVLWWNLFSIGQLILLFGFPAPPVTKIELPWSPLGRLEKIAGLIIGLLLLLPLLERWGYYDHWPSWALYAPHSSRATMLVPSYAVGRLPTSLRSITSQDPLAGGFLVRIPLEQWSLETLAVPIYPQSRFQLGVAIAVAETAGLDRDVVVEIRGASDRWQGRRDEDRLVGITALKKAADEFLFNANPRPYQP